MNAAWLPSPEIVTRSTCVPGFERGDQLQVAFVKQVEVALPVGPHFARDQILRRIEVDIAVFVGDLVIQAGNARCVIERFRADDPRRIHGFDAALFDPGCAAVVAVAQVALLGDQLQRVAFLAPHVHVGAGVVVLGEKRFGGGEKNLRAVLVIPTNLASLPRETSLTAMSLMLM